MEDIKLYDNQDMQLESSVTMSVSSVLGKSGERKIYVLFQDGKKMAEFIVPHGNNVMNKGFSDFELNKLKEYVIREQKYILSVAKDVNPMKAFLGL